MAGVSEMLSASALLWDVNVQERKMAVGLDEQVMPALSVALIGAIGPQNLLNGQRGMSSACLSTDFILRCPLPLIVCGLPSWPVSWKAFWISAWSFTLLLSLFNLKFPSRKFIGLCYSANIFSTKGTDSSFSRDQRQWTSWNRPAVGCTAVKSCYESRQGQMFLPCCLQTGCGAHPLSYSICTVVRSLGGRAARAWNGPLNEGSYTSISPVALMTRAERTSTFFKKKMRCTEESCRHFLQHSSCLHRASVTIKHFIIQLMHNI